MNAMTVLKNVVFKPAGFVGFQTVVDTQSANREEMVAGHLHESLQPAAQAFRPLVLRALQVSDRGRIG